MSYGLVKTQLSRVEDMLRDGRPYLFSKTPGLADLAVYHGLWFLSAMPIDCSAALASCAATKVWMDRISAIGHGSTEEMSPHEAIEVAKKSTPATTRSSRPTKFDPALGTRVAIRPEEYKTEEVEGDLVFIDDDEFAVHRDDPSVGVVVVHFPRVGYTLRPL